MLRLATDRSSLQLEMLEARMLLAGDAAAISSTGGFVTNFDPATPTASVAIQGDNTGELTIDTSLLPDTVKELKISGFSSVILTGSDRFDNLQLTNVRSFSGKQIDVLGTLNVRDVDALELHALAGIAWLYGDRMQMEVFDAASMTILSELDVLTISSSTNLFSLLGKPELGDQDLQLGFVFEGTNIGDIGAFTQVNFAKPPAPDNGGGTTPDGAETPPQAPTHFVIVIVSKSSLASAGASLVQLRNALDTGDASSIKLAFAEFLKNVQATSSSGASPILVANSVDRALHGATQVFALPTGTTIQISTATGHPGTPSEFTRRDSELFTSTEPKAFVSVTELAVSPVDHSDGWKSAGAPADPHSQTAFSPSLDEARNDHPASDTARASSQRVIESVRSTLAGLATDLNSGVNTVSAYILDRVGTDLEPGVLPGLLVEGRSSRLKRDVVEWIEV